MRADDPTLGVLPPLKTRARKKTFIFPSEFAQLVACELVPLEWRELYAVAAYLYLRPGELRALTFEHVDLDAKVVSVVMAYDEEADEAKPTKTEKGQRALLEGRRFLGIEITDDYSEIARERLEAAVANVSLDEFRAGQEPLFGRTG